jgi:3-phenylpropionate/trans-cinnamate dioxygenase ferredoxin reductase component
VIGGGPAGTSAALAAKKQDPSATVTLLTEEAYEPYEKPPLSKAVLLGSARPIDAPIAGPQGVAGHGVVLRTRARCANIDRANCSVALQDGGRLTYDTLVIATGSIPRELALLPPGTPRVCYLRTEADALTLEAGLASGGHVLVIGGGLIGLEVAASAALRGCRVTVIEAAARVLARVCDEDTAAVVDQAHELHGVDIRLNTTLTSIETGAAGRIRALTNAGEHLTADVVVVGIGVKPDDRLAATAGLEVRDGIVVDVHCRTSDRRIFAAGDAACFPGENGQVRLENWRHALEHGAIAGRNAAGARDTYDPVPSFWSEQYDLYIQGIGWSAPCGSRTRRPLGGASRIVFGVRDGCVVAASGINAQRDLAIARRLIERRVPIDVDALADPSQPLAAMLKR